MKKVVGAVAAVVVLFAVATFIKRPPAEEYVPADASGATAGERERLGRFWRVYRDATALRIAGQPAEAAAAYEQALALNPGHQDALYYLGNAYFDLGDLARAEQSWRRLVEVDPTNARGHSQLGVLYSCVGAPAFVHLDRAAAEFERALEINREETGSLMHLGEIALLQEDLARAESYFNAVIGSNYTSVAAYVYRAYLAWASGAGDEATQLLAGAARHAQGDAPSQAAPSEGDTRTGRAPLVTGTSICRPMRPQRSDFVHIGKDTARVADSVARALDGLLRDARRTFAQ